MAPSAVDKQRAVDDGHEEHKLDGEKNEWKFNAPYKVHEGNKEDFKAFYKGGCHCGRVKYELGRERPLRAKYCHCTTCQVLHGILSLLPNYKLSIYPTLIIPFTIYCPE